MHTADAYENFIFVFRGGDGRDYLNDLHMLNTQTLHWKNVTDVKGKKPPHIAQSPERPWHGREASPPLTSASPSPARSPAPFEPKLVIVKGWCRFRDPTRSLTQEEARDVGAHLMELMGENFGRLVIFQDPLL